MGATACDKDGPCELRRKITVNGLTFVPEELCGVPDSVLADVLTFDKSPHGRPVVMFRVCPWCAQPWAPPIKEAVICEEPLPEPEPDFEPPKDWTGD